MWTVLKFDKNNPQYEGKLEYTYKIETSEIDKAEITISCSSQKDKHHYEKILFFITHFKINRQSEKESDEIFELLTEKVDTTGF